MPDFYYNLFNEYRTLLFDELKQYQGGDVSVKSFRFNIFDDSFLIKSYINPYGKSLEFSTFLVKESSHTLGTYMLTSIPDLYFLVKFDTAFEGNLIGQFIKDNSGISFPKNRLEKFPKHYYEILKDSLIINNFKLDG